ncbi:unnamed protein product, partial [Rotaria magnacalcarata]
MTSLDNNQLSRGHRITQNKTPARYIMTPTPPPKKKQQIINSNFDPYSSKHVKKNNNQNQKVNFRADHPSLPSTTIMQTIPENQESQHVGQELFKTYRHRSRILNIKSNKKSRAFKTNTRSNLMNFDDPVEDHEISSESEVDFDDNDEQEEDKGEEQEQEEKENGAEEEDEELLENMRAESQKDTQGQPYVNNDDDDDVAICQQRPLNEYQQVYNRISRGKHQTKRVIIENNDNRTKKLRSELNELRSDFTDAVSKLVDRIDAHHEKVEKTLKIFSKQIQQTTVDSGLDKFRRDGEAFTDVVLFNNENLLDTYDRGNPGQFARDILKKLFTPAEMSESILYPNDIYAKRGLDANRMKLFKDAVRARFKISESHWHEFFNICLRRTLTQMICDILWPGKACAELANDRAIKIGRKLLDEMTENYRNNLAVLTSAMHMLMKFGDIQSAERIFRLNKKKDIITYGAMMKDNVTYIVVFNACAGLANDRAMKIGRKLIDEMPENYRNYLVVLTSAMHMLMKFGDIQSAERIFRLNKKKDIITYNVLINGYNLNDESSKCFKILEEMSHEGIVPNEIPWNILIGACSQI